MWAGRTGSDGRFSSRGHRLLPPAVPAGRVPEVVHGGIPPGPRGSGVSRVDLSASVNPYGPPPYLRVAWRRAIREVDSYPDRAQSDLRAAVGRRLGVPLEEVLLAGSASELIRCALGAYAPGREVVLPQYTYEEYRRVALAAGARRIRTVPMPSLRLDLGRMAEAIPRSGVAVLVNPATPTGQYFPPEEVRELGEACLRRGSLLLVDESYLPFVDGGRSVSSHPGSLVIFSWSKVLGTPGIPFGHASGPPRVIQALSTQLLPWTVGPLSRHLAWFALRDRRWIPETLRRIRATAEEVRKTLPHTLSRAHYFTVGSRSRPDLVRRVEAAGFHVRDLSSMGLPGRARFAVGRPAETRRFLRVLLPAISASVRRGGRSPPSRRRRP